MADKRAYARFDIGYLDNPKMLDIVDQSATAVLMHAASILYSAQHLTDGVIAERAMQRKTGGTASDSELLVNAGLWHRPGHDCSTCPEVDPGKTLVHDFLEHNRSASEAKRASDTSVAAANARWKKKGNAPSMPEALPQASTQHAESNAENADPQCLEREKEREKETSLPQASPARPTRRKTQAPEHMPITDGMKAWARENGIIVNLENETAMFLDHHASKGSTFLDWNRAWQTWMRKGKQWAKAPEPDRPSTGAASVVPIGYAWANR